jgi:ABC-type glycerol-3-phosphate transport system substrate-binding protein
MSCTYDNMNLYKFEIYLLYMTNDKIFPNTESPPHPEAALPKDINGNATPNAVELPVSVVGSETEALDPKLAEAIISQSNEDSSQQQTVAENSSAIQNKQPISTQAEILVASKKGPPKVVFILLAVFGLLIFATLIFVYLRKDKPVALVGTKGEITWWGVENDESIVRSLIDEYESQNPNVKITYAKQAEQDYRERLTSSLAQGKGPDIFEIHNSWSLMFINELSTIPGSVMSEDEYKSAFYSIAHKDFKTTAGIVAIPLEYDAITLFYNQDIFDAAAQPIPETWDDVVSASSKLTQRVKSGPILQSGVALGSIENIDYWPDIISLMIIQNGSDPLKPNDKALTALNFYLSFSSPLRVWDTTLPNSVSAFAKNKLGMLFAPARAASDIVSENSSLRFRTSNLPQLPKNNPTDPDHSYATYWAQGVWARSKNSEVAWDFLKFMSSGESLQKMNEIRKNRNAIEKAYPRPEMAILQKDDKILGSIVSLAGKSKSSVLYDLTFDGQTGVNTQINNAYKETISSLIAKKEVKKILPLLISNISEILTKYNTKK